MKNISKILITSAVCVSFILSAAGCSGKTEATTEASTSETTTTATTAAESSSESSKDTEGPAGKGADNTDASSASSASSPAKITVEYADEDKLDKDNTVSISLVNEGQLTSVLFTTDTEVKDFKILSLEFTNVDDNGNPKYKYETVYSQPALTPGSNLVAQILFAGDIPNNGFAYTDTDGSLKIFALGLSGEDGSIVVTEI